MTKKEDIRRINEDLAARFRKMEEALLSARTVAGLFEALVDGIEREFAVPFVWFAFVDRPAADALTDAAVASEILKSRFSVVSEELLERMLPGGLHPVLSNQNLQPFYRLMPPCQKYFVRSIAVVPFALDGRMIGAWNNGDADANRYSPDMDTALLASLADKLSRRLTELVAQRKAASAAEKSAEQPGGVHG
ncbi:MAG TPA: DUF484 family protein [Smithellaceae bacterium]|nr:DUF484 family protein [Smithellaceae bacterium]HRS82628.1 DUF484 family protein [Smithellaceae bacterium]HRV44815.1 DUF484 family protein [Smithellaceae bacterium]